MHSINLNVEKLLATAHSGANMPSVLATAHSGANIPECRVTPSNNSLRHTYNVMYMYMYTTHSIYISGE